MVIFFLKKRKTLLLPSPILSLDTEGSYAIYIILYPQKPPSTKKKSFKKSSHHSS